MNSKRFPTTPQHPGRNARSGMREGGDNGVGCRRSLQKTGTEVASCCPSAQVDAAEVFIQENTQPPSPAKVVGEKQKEPRGQSGDTRHFQHRLLLQPSPVAALHGLIFSSSALCPHPLHTALLASTRTVPIPRTLGSSSGQSRDDSFVCPPS